MKPPFVTTLEPEQIPLLESTLKAEGFSFSERPYMRFFAEKTGISCALYKSGKIVIQGKASPDWVSFTLEPEILGAFPFSHQELSIDKEAHLGLDESGKGDLFGPLVVAGVYADAAGIEELLKIGVKDCKKLTDAKTKSLSAKIKKKFIYHTLVLLPEKYNELYTKIGNLNHLLAWGHATVIGKLAEKSGCYRALVDQFANPALLLKKVQSKDKRLKLEQKTHAEADPVVAAASIIARESFLRHLENLGKLHGINLPKGAGAPSNQALQAFLSRHGPEALSQVAKLHFKNCISHR